MLNNVVCFIQEQLINLSSMQVNKGVSLLDCSSLTKFSSAAPAIQVKQTMKTKVMK